MKNNTKKLIETDFINNFKECLNNYLNDNTFYILSREKNGINNMLVSIDIYDNYDISELYENYDMHLINDLLIEFISNNYVFKYNKLDEIDLIMLKK